MEEGQIAEVFSSQGVKLGLAIFNRGRSIVAHMIAYGDDSVEEALQKRVRAAIALRRQWFDPAQTNAYRLINAEGDGIPGVIIDAYCDVLVLQISNGGIETIKEKLLAILIEEFQPKAIFEKSTSFLRKKEGLEEVRALLYGQSPSEIEILEQGLCYAVDLLKGQKTGLFLDQREMRSWVKSLSKNRKVLNCFAYTGGFSISALAGGASFVDSVEISSRCPARVEKNIALNHLPQEKHRFVLSDVFEFLKDCAWDYDLVILDPPAFVKKREDIAQAFRAYKELNRQAMEKMRSGSLLLTCSCSYHVEESLFQNILFRAANEAKRQVKIVGKHRQAIDHPISIFHPESAYLKSYMLYIE